MTNLNQNSCKLDFNLLEELSRLEVQKQLDENFSELLTHLKTKHPQADKEYLERVLRWCRPRITKLKELDAMTYLWEDPKDVQIRTPRSHLEEFSKSDMTKVMDFISAHGLNKKIFMKDIRLILCGRQVSKFISISLTG